jgi:enoyl-[acyl-carrier-protein] reductase (NADH)
MAEKAAKVRLQALASGPIKALSTSEIDRIHTRPDEHYRQQLLRQLTK